MKNFKLLIFTALVLLLAGCGNNQKITVASHVWPGYEFMFLGRSLGYLDAGLVSLHETRSASETLELLRTGKVDGGALTFDEVIRATEEGLDLVVVLVFNISAGADVVLARPSIKTPADLNGKAIAVEVGSVGSIMLDQLLRKAGLTAEEVNVVNVTVDQHLEAWKAGKMDAVITYEPISSKIANLDGHEIFTSQQAPNLIVDVLALKRSALKNQQSIMHLMDVHFKAKKHFTTHHQDGLFRMAPRLDVDAKEVDSAFKGLYLPDYHNNLRLLSGQQPELLKSARLLKNILGLQQGEQDNRALDQVIDDSFLLTIEP